MLAKLERFVSRVVKDKTKMTNEEFAALREQLKQKKMAEQVAKKEELKKKWEEEKQRRKEEREKVVIYFLTFGFDIFISELNIYGIK